MNTATVPIASPSAPFATPARSDVPLAEYHDPQVLLPGEARSLLTGAPWRRLVVIGDSAAEGLGDPVLGYDRRPWADRVAANLAIAYTNLGLRGLTAPEIRDEQLTRAIGWRPDLAMVVAGGNDAFSDAFDVDATGAAIEQIYGGLQSAGARVIGFTVPDASAIHEGAGARAIGERFAELNRRIREIATRRGVTLVDLATRSFSVDPTAYSADGMHLNMRGHAVIASLTVEALGELVRDAEGEL